MAFGSKPTGRGNDFTIFHKMTASSVDEFVGILPRDCRLIEATYLSTVAGTDASAVTLAARKITDNTSAPSAAAGATVVEQFTGTINLKTAANAEAAATVVETSGANFFQGGDRLAQNVTGTLTAVNGVMMYRFLAL